MKRDDYCPLLVTCLKTRVDEPQQEKLEQMINIWEKEKTAVQLLAAVGRLALKLRIHK